MRGTKLACATLTLAGLTVAMAQPPGGGQKPSGGTALDDALTKALSHSPEVQVAEAKLREAEAELRRARLTLMQKVIDAQSAIDAQKRLIGAKEAELARIMKLAKAGTISHEEVQFHERALADAKASLARLELTLNALIGNVPDRFTKLVENKPEFAGQALFNVVGGPADAAKPPHPAIAERIRKALDARLKPTEFQGATLGDAIEFLSKLSGAVPFVSAIGDKKNENITLTIFADVPLGGHLQALQDLAPGLQIFVRDYGLFFTFDNAPELGVTVADFWHEGKAIKP